MWSPNYDAAWPFSVTGLQKHILQAELAYERDGLFGTFSVSHLTKRYFSYENDVSAPAHTVAELAFGYRFSGTPVLEGLEMQVNVTNLLGEDYISSMGTGGFAVRGDSMTLMSSPPRQVFVTVRKAF